MPSSSPGRILSFVGGCLSAILAVLGLVMIGAVLSGQAPLFLVLFAIAFAALAVGAMVICLRNAFQPKELRGFSVTIREEEPAPLSRIPVQADEEADSSTNGE
jgi:hypothetical protein